MNVRLPKTVKGLYTLVDKCARIEVGRKLPGQEDCTNVDSEDDDESTSQKKSKKRSKRQKHKTVMTIEGLGTPSTGKKAKAEILDKVAAVCADCWEAATARRPGKVMGRIARFIGPRATTFKSAIRLSSLLKDRR